MNNKGFMVSTSIFAIMLITSIIIFMFYGPIVNGAFAAKTSGDKFIKSIEERNTQERIHAIIHTDPSLIDPLSFAGLGFESAIVTVPGVVTQQTVEQVTEDGAASVLQFELTRNSTIVIEVDYVVPWNSGVSHPPGISRYSFQLIHETQGAIVLSGVRTTDIVGPILVSVPSEMLPLGKYTLTVTPSKLDIEINTTYEVTEGDQQMLHLLKDGEVVYSVKLEP